MSIPEAIVRLILDDKTKAGVKSAQSGMTVLSNAARSLMVQLVAAAGIGGMGAFIKSAINAGDRIQKLALSSGMSAEALSELKFVAQQSGIEFEKLPASMVKLQKAIAEARDGSESFADAFNKLGIDVEKFAQLNADQQFEVIGGAIGRMSDESMRTQVTMQLLGRSGTDLFRIFKGGTENYKALREEAHKLGLTLSQENVDSMAAANDAINRLKSSARGLANVIAVEVAPVIVDMVNLFQVHLPGAMNILDRSLDWIQDSFNTTGGTILGVYEKIFGFLGKFPNMISGMQQFYQDMAAEAERLQFIVAEDREEFEKSNVSLMKYNRTMEISAEVLDEVLTPAVVNNKKEQEELKKAIEAVTNEWQESNSEAESLIESTRTSEEKYVETIAHLKDLLAQETIQQETYNRAVKQAQEEFYGLSEIIQSTKNEYDAYAETINKLDLALQDGIITQELYGKAAEKAADDLWNAHKEAKEAESAMKKFKDVGVSAFKDLIIDGKDFESVLASIAKQLVDLAMSSDNFKKLFDLNKSSSGGGFLSDIASIFGAVLGFFGGGSFGSPNSGSVMGDPGHALDFVAAGGADFTVGGTGGTDSKTLVGKVTPGERVKVIPNNKKDSGGINVTINAPGADAGTVARIRTMIEQEFVPRVIRQAGNETLSAISKRRFY